ncbi:MAG: putative redox protein [Flavobacteriales bacterium]|jgi:putative redox protein
MTTSTVKYLGNLRTEATHLQSNSKLITDAPIDNNGKGEAFSPTDILATSLASCMITIMGISAKAKGWELRYCESAVEKIMAANPRRVSAINIDIKLQDTWNESQRKTLETAAKSCPVAFSLHADLMVNLTFTYIKQ